MNKHFVHLHLHTEFSLLDGAVRINKLLAMAKEQQWKAVGISDHGNIFGAVKFFQMAKKEKIKPILGIEMYCTPDVRVKNVNDKYDHLLLIVQNEEGYRNLCELISFSFNEGFYFKPRIDYAHLEKHSAGLIATSACIGGHIPSLILEQKMDAARQQAQWFKDLFGQDRFFLELHPPQMPEQIIVNDGLLTLSRELEIHCTAACDAHFLRPDDREAHEVLLSIQTKDTLDNPDRFSFGDFQGHLRTTDDMLEIFKDHQEVVWQTGKIADSCEFEFVFGKLFFPQFPIPEEHTQESFFAKLCWDGLTLLKQRGIIPADLYAVYDERLKIEIDLITNMGYIGYFLVVSDFIQWGKKQGIPIGPGRGSAAGSLVAWAMQITNVDPIKYNLLFERFLNPERVSMPDIDIDFCIERREEVINYVKDKYGHDCVCQIITFGTMMAKGVIKDVARVLGFPFQDANAITELIPEQLKITINEAIEQEPRLAQMIETNPKIKHLIDICLKLEGLTRHASKHAAGVVISPSRLSSTMPLYIPPKTSDLVSQYTMTDLEALGFLKMDFLGLKNLTIIQAALTTIKKNHDVEIDLDLLALDDPKTFALLCRGETDGVFQFESDGIKDVLRKLQPDKFEDLIAVNALYRPGPLGSGMVDDYIERRHGRKKTTYMFAELEPVLAETYGVIVYQEQVMKIASAIGGYSLGGADILRRAMGKKKAEVMAEQKSLFCKGAASLHFDEKKAGELFDLMAYFAGYGFNKSHSTAYALVAYHTAYLKAHYPYEFMAALISYETENPAQFTHYLQSIHEMGLELLPPNINESEIEFASRGKSILFGLKGVKNVGTTALQAIITERSKKPFIDLLDFCKRVDLRTVNKRVLENLIAAGAFDCLSGNRAQKTAELDKIIDLALQEKESAKTGQMGLFGALSSAGKGAHDASFIFQPLDDWSDKQKLEKEKEVVGFYISSHPLQSYPQLAWLQVDTVTTCLEKIQNVTSLKEPFVTCVGLKQSCKVITTKKGDRMAFVEMEDATGRYELVVFPTTFAKVEALLDQFSVFVVKGAVDITSQNKCKIKANALIPAEHLFVEYKDVYHMRLTFPPAMQGDFLKDVRTSLGNGKVPLEILFEENQETLVLQAAFKVDCAKESLQQLASQAIKIAVTV
ncbi:MAG: polymerase III, alpha subunit protein [candidate division TM6 bacterium GW2011_GWF2_38_10]|nr:MAG: polymerase III, alpha subunit protein [candidate division TM6 bacterium GW2011_GWF2_38_10]